MDRNVGVRKLIADLVKDEQIEVRRSEIIARDLAQWCDSTGRAPSGDELEAWLGKHAQVLELYAGTKLLDELIERYLCPPPVKVYVEAEHPELEAHLHDGPDVPEPYMVYADWLQEQSDVRGELIALGVAATTMAGTKGGFEATGRFESYLKEHDERLFGKLTRQLWGLIDLTWKYGLVRSIEEVGETSATAGLWDELLGLRVCRLVQSIAFNQPLGLGVEEAVAAAAPTLKHLKIRVRHRVPSLLMARPLRSLSLSGGSVALRADSLPDTLDKLELAVADIDSVDASLALGVRELHLWTNPKLARFASRLRLPRVERLRIELGDEDFDIGKMLESLALPLVTHLTIANGRIDKDEIVTLTRLPWTRQITSLALTGVELSDDSLQMLVDSHALPSLRELDLSSNELTAAALARAHALAETVIDGRQHEPGTAANRGMYQWAGARRGVGEIDENGWQQVGRDGEILWARYRGSADYELFVSSTDNARFGCTCPSRYQPCKHVVALALLAQRTEIPQQTAQLTTLVV